MQQSAICFAMQYLYFTNLELVALQLRETFRERFHSKQRRALELKEVK